MNNEFSAQDIALPSKSGMVESRILFVGMEESMLLFWDYCNQAICILTLIKL